MMLSNGRLPHDLENRSESWFHSLLINNTLAFYTHCHRDTYNTWQREGASIRREITPTRQTHADCRNCFLCQRGTGNIWYSLPNKYASLFTSLHDLLKLTTLKVSGVIILLYDTLLLIGIEHSVIWRRISLPTTAYIFYKYGVMAMVLTVLSSAYMIFALQAIVLADLTLIRCYLVPVPALRFRYA